MNKNVFGEVVNPLEDENLETGKKIAVYLGILIYAVVLFYTGAHSWNLLVNAVTPETRWIAAIGFAAVELNAIALPLALKFWAHGGMHRGLTMAFYALDLIILYANSVINADMVRGGSLPAWGSSYLVNIAPATPLFALIVWSVLWTIDPEASGRDKIRRLKSHAQQMALNRATEYFGSDDFLKAIAPQGRRIANQILNSAFGGGSEPRQISGYVSGTVEPDLDLEEEPEVRNF